VRKEVLTHCLYLLVFSVAVVLVKRYFLPLNVASAINIVLFLIGGLIGTALPDVDHFIYVYLLHPQELTSQRINYAMTSPTQPVKQRVWSVFELMALTRGERKGLIFHTAHFQIIFWVLAFLVVSSSGSILGRGLVLAFALHLIVDQILDLNMVDNLDNWFRQWNIQLEKEKYMFYWLGNLALLLILGLVM
jgi:hypothetical protein